jgi:hypothetical protein
MTTTVTDSYTISLSPKAAESFRKAAEPYKATLREIMEGVLNILGENPVLLDGVIDGDLVARGLNDDGEEIEIAATESV